MTPGVDFLLLMNWMTRLIPGLYATLHSDLRLHEFDALLAALSDDSLPFRPV